VILCDSGPSVAEAASDDSESERSRPSTVRDFTVVTPEDGGYFNLLPRSWREPAVRK
jgi:hypothetical protein